MWWLGSHAIDSGLIGRGCARCSLRPPLPLATPYFCLSFSVLNFPLLFRCVCLFFFFVSETIERYVGVTGLAAIVRDHPKYAQQHQMAVIDCLEDPDETLKRKTLDLLYTMTNPVNVEFIADKLLSFLEQGTDSFWRQVMLLGIIVISFCFGRLVELVLFLSCACRSFGLSRFFWY